MKGHLFEREGLNPLNEFHPATFYWSTHIKLRKWEVMYFCIRGIDFASEIFLLDFETVPTLIVFVFQLIVIPSLFLCFCSLHFT
jgi:hypothetical protein